MTEWEFSAFVTVHAETEEEAITAAEALVSARPQGPNNFVSLDDGPPLAIDWEKT